MVLRRLNYEGERDLKTATDFINGGGQLKGGSSAAAGTAESEDDDDDVSDTKPSKGKTSGTRSRPARTATPTADSPPGYRNDSAQTLASSAESLSRSSAFSVGDRLGALLDRARSDDHEHPIASRQGNNILRPGSSGSDPDYRRISHFSPLRGSHKSAWLSDSGLGAPHTNAPTTGSGLLSSSALLGLDGPHAEHPHQELLSNFARHRASLLAHAGGAGPGTGRRLAAPYSATPPLPPTSLTGQGAGTGGDDSWLDFLAMPSTSMSLSLLVDHPTALGGSHASAAGGYDFPFGLGLGGAGRGGGGGGGGSGGLGIPSYGLPEGAELDKERELLAREGGGNEFGPRKRPRWE